MVGFDPAMVLVNGKPRSTEGSYYIEWYVDSRDAVNPRVRIQPKHLRSQSASANDQDQILGIEIAGKTHMLQRLSAECLPRLPEEIRQQRRPKTFAQYRRRSQYFPRGCGEICFGSIKRRDLINFMAFWLTEVLTSRTSGTKVQVVVTMLKANGMNGILKMRIGPATPKPSLKSSHCG